MVRFMATVEMRVAAWSGWWMVDAWLMSDGKMGDVFSVKNMAFIKKNHGEWGFNQDLSVRYWGLRAQK